MRWMLRTREWRVALSVGMVVIEALVGVLLPFAIGLAVQDLAESSYRGVIFLATTGVVGTAFAVLRRVHDARLYAAVRLDASQRVADQKTELSVKTARLTMLGEVVDFLEYAMPEVVASVCAFIGVLIFLAVIDLTIFFAALLLAVTVIAVYAFTTARTQRFNFEYNNEAERQVEILRQEDRSSMRSQIGLLNRWLVKMSDLDATNFAISGVLATALQVFAVLVAFNRGLEAGELLSLVLYVVEFSLVATLLPSAWQDCIRLRDILTRLHGNLPAGRNEDCSGGRSRPDLNAARDRTPGRCSPGP